MRRTKLWWERLTHAERNQLYHLEHDCCYSNGDRDTWFCSCGNSSAGGLCEHCSARLKELLTKAEGAW